MPPSGAPTRPSALSGPCQTSFHLRPPAMTPGISVVVTSLAGVGWRNSPPPPPALRCCCCATAIVLSARADPRKQQAIAHVAFRFISPPNGLAASSGRNGIRVCLRQAAVYTGGVTTANVTRRARRDRGRRCEVCLTNLEEGEPGEFNQDISGEKEEAQ